MPIALPESERFEGYEREFQTVQDDIQTKLDDGSEGVDRLIDEAYEILDNLALEIQSIPSGQRAPYNAKLRGYRSGIDKSKRRLAEQGQSGDRAALFGNQGGSSRGASIDSDVGSNQRQQLLSGQQSLDRSSDRLRESQRVANETEFIGASILNDLRGQREQIENSRNTLQDADSNVDRSLRTLRTMTRRMAANKVITYAIIAVLVILIVFVILSKFW